ncbi:MAG: hypothetical protein RIE73_32865 [Coleofasciculus sp. C1-SOL-03]|jgi:hypothetical protein|uniref:hypothetical protein n=1 Tax=Coleofasciculus sp. C1-SOL-03 TaxID=3069522 RepID=UPI0032F65835
MATIAHPRSDGIITSPKLLVRESRLLPQQQSQERQKLAQLTEMIWQHLTPSEQLLESLVDIEEISYRPMPPNRSFSVRVRYRNKRRGKPLSYSLDLDDE